ncbi:MAG: DNA mismatch endonuclease Vsr [Planctomycetota bacterium]
MPSEQRSRTMRAVKSRDTGPELLVATLLDELRVRYRRDAVDLPGRPDFVVEPQHEDKERLAVFVHGCWWHGHDCPRGARVPKSNRDYWVAKITRNRRRDRRVATELRKLGWSVWTVWECQLRDKRLPGRLASRLKRLG